MCWYTDRLTRQIERGMAMDRAHTQFWVSVLGMVFLGASALVALIGTLFYDAPDQMAFLLIGGLVSVTSTAAAWLFRINHANRSPGGR